ncbi:MAG: serine hydrolase domain-containing protein [Meiothermus sp.]|uniref:serine hydrolase domain-containing protein n=1 Tax=Meiothermus sp. TaxID=1955249 RepID=UPI00298F14E9|nr:serine hydrolase domain-containing protein [Meiothermus sp.]MDW8426014.1 serine hydrolase domain-containing protein [Meiothermus sp.]
MPFQSLQTLLLDPLHAIPSLQVAVIRAGEIVYAGSFGYRYLHPADPDQHLPVNHQTRFRVASISKLVVALGLMRLVERGQIDLDADVSEYLGFTLRNPAFPAAPIRVRHLLCHTSSLRDGSRYSIPSPHTLQDFFTPEGRFFEGGAHFDPQHGPGAYACYANLNTGVLGTLLECACKQRFDVFMEQEVLRPLGMEGGFNVSRFTPAQIGNLAVLYRKRMGEAWNPAGPWVAQVDDYGGVVPPGPMTQNPDAPDDRLEVVDLGTYRPGTNATFFSPQGGLRASALELAQVALLFMGQVGGVRFLRPETLEQMTEPQWTWDGHNGDPLEGQALSWGLGVWRFTNTPGLDCPVKGHRRLWYGHLGDAYGLLSGLLFDLEGNALIYIIGGQGCDPATFRGAYSAYTGWEEEVLSALYGLLS